MASIPVTQKFHTVAADVDTENKGSALANADRESYTMQDIIDTVSTEGGIDGSGTLERFLYFQTLILLVIVLLKRVAVIFKFFKKAFWLHLQLQE